MLSTYEYMLAWAMYLLAAIALFVALYLLSRGWAWPVARSLFRGLLAALLFTPAVSMPGSSFLAPANLLSVIALVQHDFDLAEKAFLSLGIAVVLVMLILVTKALVEKMFAR
jgi:hypothetical protein